MSAQKDSMTVTLRLMSREYTVACPPEEHEALIASAEYLNERMNTIRKRGKALGAERIAVMAALNISRELLDLRGEGVSNESDSAASQRLRQLRLDVESTLADSD